MFYVVPGARIEPCVRVYRGAAGKTWQKYLESELVRDGLITNALTTGRWGAD